MACYDCEDCNKHINNGGKCKQFEYNCPYDLVDSININSVKQIQEKAKEIERLIKDIESLDAEGTLWNEISNLRIGLNEIIDYSSDDIIVQWREINE